MRVSFTKERSLYREREERWEKYRQKSAVKGLLLLADCLSVMLKLLWNFLWKLLTGASDAFAWRALHKRSRKSPAANLSDAIIPPTSNEISARFPLPRHNAVGKHGGIHRKRQCRCISVSDAFLPAMLFNTRDFNFPYSAETSRHPIVFQAARMHGDSEQFLAAQCYRRISVDSSPW